MFEPSASSSDDEGESSMPGDLGDQAKRKPLSGSQHHSSSSDALSLVEKRVVVFVPSVTSVSSRSVVSTTMVDEQETCVAISSSSVRADKDCGNDDVDDDDFIVHENDVDISTADPDPHSVAAALALHEKEMNAEIKRRTSSFSCLPRGGLVATAASISAATLGSSALIIPYCFQRSAIIPGSLMLILNALFTCYTVFLLGRLLARLGETSYEALTARLLGSAGAGKATALSVAFFGWGCAAVYAAVLKSVLGPFALRLAPAAWSSTSQDSERVKIVVSAIAGLCTQVPLSLREHIQSLRYFSTLGTCSVLLLGFAVAHRCWFSSSPSGDGVVATRSASNISGTTAPFSSPQERISARLVVPTNVAEFTATLGIFAWSYACQTNTIPCFDELRDKSASRLAKACAMAVFMCTFFYCMIGTAGVGAFGADLHENVIENLLPHQQDGDQISLDGILACMSVGVTVVGCFPVSLLPAREAILEATASLFSDSRGSDNIDDSDSTQRRRFRLGLFMSLTALFTGILAPGLVSICSMVGGFTGVWLSFCLPVYLTWLHGELLNPAASQFYSLWHVAACGTVLVFGAGSGAIGSCVAIMNVAASDRV